VGLLAGDWLVLLQSPLVEGEQAALEEQQASPLWQQLRSVEAGRVVVLDRLGDPGIEGRTRAARDLAGALRP
jgi:iron complex transport system substrate-binding protein